MISMIKHKKIFSLIITVLMCLCLLVGCGKSENVKAVEAQISAIGAVGENSLSAIESTEAAFDNLSEKEKKKVENYNVLLTARDEYDQIRADEVSGLIEKIGTVDEKSDKKISAAEKAYSDLTDAQKAKVENLNVLETSREEYYSVLVSNVEKAIDAIEYNGEEPTTDLKKAVGNAKKQYDKLDDTLKERVKNYSILKEISTTVSKYYIQKAQDAISAAIEMDSGYEEAEKLYNLLDAEEKEQISDYNIFSENYTAYKNRPPIDITGYVLRKDIIGNPELRLNAKNVTDKIIKEFVIYVCAYDNDGVPVPVYFGDYVKGYRYDEAVKPGETLKTNAYWQLYGTYNDMKQFVIILSEVEFFDGSVWENRQTSTLISQHEQQLLKEGDPNIIPRS